MKIEASKRINAANSMRTIEFLLKEITKKLGIKLYSKYILTNDVGVGWWIHHESVSKSDIEKLIKNLADGGESTHEVYKTVGSGDIQCECDFDYKDGTYIVMMKLNTGMQVITIECEEVLQ